jgi:crotonobetainyl-CoA:carnitine CoA-transferase CaiB-like acyl-CoA transferase
VPCGPIYQIDEVFADPQVRHIGIAREIEHSQRGRQQLLGQAVELSRTPWSLRMPAPEKGDSTDSVLTGLGYDAETIAKLRSDGTI